jgi:putative MATE family efflux protein
MKDLTQGRIIPQLIRLALPIMGTGLAQLAYNFADTLWLGRLSSHAVAAVSIAGLIAWFTYAIACLTKIGAEVCIAQAIGRHQLHAARLLASNAIVMSAIISVATLAGLLLFMRPLVGLFNLAPDISEACLNYLSVLAWTMPVWFLAPTFSGIYNATGNSRTPFIVSTIGIALNIALDPLLIFGIGFFPELGVLGAAVSTAVALVVEVTLFVALLGNPRTAPFAGFRFVSRLGKNMSLRLLKVGAPASLQSALFAAFSTVVSTIAASVGGHVGVAVQGVGSQIESLSWIAAGGVSTALGAYVGQNYGAGYLQRVKKSFVGGVSIVSVYGAVVGVCFVFLGGPIFGFFIPNDAAVQVAGADYLFIFGLSQLFLCIEISSTGAFNGLGRSYFPATVSIVFNALRIPLAIVLSRHFGLNGVWLAMSITIVFKGVILAVAFPLVVKKLRLKV